MSMSSHQIARGCYGPAYSRLPYWRLIVKLASDHATPFFLISAGPFLDNHRTLREKALVPAQVRQWYSFKTQPVPQLALFAKTLGMGIEVVSKYELAAAQQMGFTPSDTLVNGVAKHAWLSRDFAGLNVIFNSLRELAELAPVASTSVGDVEFGSRFRARSMPTPPANHRSSGLASTISDALATS